MNNSWGYNEWDNNYKSSAKLIQEMITVVSRDGNYLLNIGPKGDGTVQEQPASILNIFGEWMDINSESIYGTTASPLPSQTWGFCTARDSLLYLHVLDWPETGTLEVSGLKNQPVNCYLLASKMELEVKREGSSILIDLPGTMTDTLNTVIALQVAGKPESEPPVLHAGTKDTVTLGYLYAVTEGKAVKRYNRKGNFYF